MPYPIYKTRILFSLLAAMAGFCSLGFKLVQLQGQADQRLIQRADRNTTEEVIYYPQRGEIKDVNGRTLAHTVVARPIFLNPYIIGEEYKEFASFVAPFLNMDVNALAKEMKPRTNGTGTPIQEHKLMDKLPINDWDRLKAALDNYPEGVDPKSMSTAEKKKYREIRVGGIYSHGEDRMIRIYPGGRLAAHTLGYVVGTEVERGDGIKVLEDHGGDGVEKSFDSHLSGKIGWRIAQRRRGGKEIVTAWETFQEPEHGGHVYLTMDQTVQYHLESEMLQACKERKPDFATGVVVEVKTGRIVAMASLPAYHPETKEDINSYAKNNVIAARVPPGSVFKIVTYAAAFDQKLTYLDEQIFCENGRWNIPKAKALTDWKSFPTLTIRDAIAKSSNIACSKVGFRMTKDTFYDYILKFGFARQTGILLDGENAGYINPNPDKWYPTDFSRLHIGYAISVTPLQMAMAMAAVANDGMLMEPIIVDRLENADGQVTRRFYPEPVNRIASVDAIEKVQEGLEHVMLKGGTGLSALPSNIVVAGKTGTARIIHRGGVIGHNVSFSGYFPAEDPKYSVTIMLYRPRVGKASGGGLAGPVFKGLAEKMASYYNIQSEPKELVSSN